MSCEAFSSDGCPSRLWIRGELHLPGVSRTPLAAPAEGISGTSHLDHSGTTPRKRQALEDLHEAHIFTKLDLRSAYNLVHIRKGDEWKTPFITPSEIKFLGYVIDAAGIRMDERQVAAVRDWPVPALIKKLQRFLGFANVYRRFIGGFSLISAPLMSLLLGKAKTLSWTPEAQQAFEELRKRFCAAPLLCHPDPQLLFVVEVDASSTGLGATLSQQAGTPPRLHPCAYSSKKLSPAEQNYDNGNSELLAIKLALEEWRHWLEGAAHPFTVITDHKNLQYLREAKRLNPRQARWALCFTRFNFSITHRPRTKNGKADALSRVYGPEEPAEPGPILPPALILSPIVWHLDEAIRTATRREPAPPGCPRNRTFVPSRVSTGLTKGGYWWPGMSNMVAEFIRGCNICGISKTPRHLPVGKLIPLPTSQRLWSHIGIDFVTDLPRSEGFTCILLVVDRFSKACRFVHLRGLPMALETAEALFHHVFRNFGLPGEIVSDRGSQFTSHVWRAFFQLLGVTVNLSSGYHPQSNGQTEWKIQELGRKLSPRYIGPFRIEKRINEAAYRLELPPRYRIHPTFHVSLLKPYTPSSAQHASEVRPPPPEVLEQPLVYSVRKVLNSRRHGGGLEYLVDWEGYGPEERSWVARWDILDPALLEEFHATHPLRPAPQGRGRPRRRDMYKYSVTAVKCAVGTTDWFKVEVGLHQGSALSSFLFAVVMDRLTDEVRQESPWTMMYADDIVICGKSREQVEKSLKRWGYPLEKRGMKVSRSKTEYMCVNEREGSGVVWLQEKEVEEFRSERNFTPESPTLFRDRSSSLRCEGFDLRAEARAAQPSSDTPQSHNLQIHNDTSLSQFLHITHPVCSF
ncbi:hypothetical protein C0J50_8520 [Silurus asotus]|uniref:ribonuclease H n=1 Tax=Silurus asotus TaxID=30991 RepID=A0AAD5AHI4_SILAS|nr:hypothetical protein C0J50_8520 [Silurus asotus]